MIVYLGEQTRHVRDSTGKLFSRRSRLVVHRGRRVKDVTVARVRGNDAIKRHLENLGFVEGSRVHVVSASGSNIIVMVKGARFGLDAKVAAHVMTA